MNVNKKVLVSHIFLINTLLYAIYIFIVSTSPTAPGAETGRDITSYFSFIAHYVLYFGFSYFVFVTYKEFEKYSWNPFLSTVVSVSIYGLIIEVFQYYIPYRHFSLIDGLINLLGAISFVLIAYLLKKLPENKVVEFFYLNHI